MSKENNEKSRKKNLVYTDFFSCMNDDLIEKILSKLPAKSFAFACCVNRSWKKVCNHILSRPKIVSAFSRNPNQLRGGEEVLDKVLSEPIKPDFVIANITCGNMDETLALIINRVGSKIPIIVSIVAGILGKEACNDKVAEVRKYATTKDELNENPNFAILLTIGYLPGMKVDIIPVIQAKKELKTTIGYEFVKDINNFMSEVSKDAAPACVILFGEDTHATEPVVRYMDYAMPAETIIVGDQKGKFLHKRANESINVELHKDDSRVLAGLVFARDRHRPAQTGRIKFDTAISNGMSSVERRYKAINIRTNLPTSVPWTLMTAQRIGEAELLDGDQIIDDIEEILLGNQIWENDPYIGVIKRRKYYGLDRKSKIIRRKYSGLDKTSKIMDSLVFHQVSRSDEEYLQVCGSGIKTYDEFQFYFPDANVAKSSLNVVSSQLRNLKSKQEVIGGFVFACSGRHDSFFGRPNTNISPFLENFPELPFGGIFCGGEIGRDEEEPNIRRCIHVYSSVYLIISYTSSSSS